MLSDKAKNYITFALIALIFMAIILVVFGIFQTLKKHPAEPAKTNQQYALNYSGDRKTLYIKYGSKIIKAISANDLQIIPVPGTPKGYVPDSDYAFVPYNVESGYPAAYDAKKNQIFFTAIDQNLSAADSTNSERFLFSYGIGIKKINLVTNFYGDHYSFDPLIISPDNNYLIFSQGATGIVSGEANCQLGLTVFGLQKNNVANTIYNSQSPTFPVVFIKWNSENSFAYGEEKNRTCEYGDQSKTVAKRTYDISSGKSELISLWLTPTPSPMPLAISDWQTYPDQGLGITFKYKTFDNNYIHLGRAVALLNYVNINNNGCYVLDITQNSQIYKPAKMTINGTIFCQTNDPDNYYYTMSRNGNYYTIKFPFSKTSCDAGDNNCLNPQKESYQNAMAIIKDSISTIQFTK